MPITVETCVARHTGDRVEQQDRVGLLAHPRYPEIMMAVLADGMGGHSGGALAAEQVMLKAKEIFDAYRPASESADMLLGGILKEAHVVIKLTRFTTEKDPHSTAVALMVQPGRVNWVHCGDSRLYHFRGGRTLSRSADHSLVGELMRKGRLDEAATLVHPQRNVLLSCLGSDREPNIDYGEVGGHLAGDSFLLCSDGLWAYFSDDELAQAVSIHSPREAAQQLIRHARERAAGSGDNISLAIVKLVEAPARRNGSAVNHQ